jgi:hypothetical protein
MSGDARRDSKARLRREPTDRAGKRDYDCRGADTYLPLAHHGAAAARFTSHSERTTNSVESR